MPSFSEDGDSENNMDSGGENETEDNSGLNDGSENEQGEDENNLTKTTPKEKNPDPNKIKKPLMIVDFNGRACFVLLNKKPSDAGKLWIKYEDNNEEEEVFAEYCKINLLTEA